MKKDLIKGLIIILGMNSVVVPGYAWFGKKKTASEQLKVQEVVPVDDTVLIPILKELESKMKVQFTEIEGLLAKGESEKALSLAKSSLDEVRVRTGIDPKVKLQDSMPVSIVFPENVSQFSKLSLTLQKQVILAAQTYLGGLYMDILNLSKRTTLLYIKALHGQIVKNGGLLQEDRLKIIQDLAKATLIAIPIVDKNGKTIIVYDQEIANEDHIYMFNREIKLYILNSKELGIDEKKFEAIRNEVNGKDKNSVHSRVNQDCVGLVNQRITGSRIGVDKQTQDFSINYCSQADLTVDRDLDSCLLIYMRQRSRQVDGYFGVALFTEADQFCRKN